MSSNDIKPAHQILSEQEAILNEATERVEKMEEQVAELVEEKKKKKAPTRWSYVKQEFQVKKGKAWVKDTKKKERPWESARDRDWET